MKEGRDSVDKAKHPLYEEGQKEGSHVRSEMGVFLFKMLPTTFLPVTLLSSWVILPPNTKGSIASLEGSTVIVEYFPLVQRYEFIQVTINTLKTYIKMG